MRALPPLPPAPAVESAFAAALAAAEAWRGNTAPNPAVGAAALAADGRLLAVRAHERAGTAHAEAAVLDELRSAGRLDQIALLVVTLEPCNHHGRTPPCSEGILAAGVPRVLAGAPDPNPVVAGGGLARLRAGGVEADWAPTPGLREACARLLRPFAKRCLEGLPYVTVKTAWRPREGRIPAARPDAPIDSPAVAPARGADVSARDLALSRALFGSDDWTMIPPPGRRTFSAPASIALAHRLRRRADALLTGPGTLIADRPELTVRALSDFPDRSRELLVLDPRGRAPATELERLTALGHRVRVESELERALREAAGRGALEVLVEAGPTLAGAVLATGFWDEHVIIRTAPGSAAQEDHITHVFRNH